MTENVAELETLFQSAPTLDSYPQLRDAALSNQGNARRLEELANALSDGAGDAAKKGVALWILGRTSAALECLERAHPKDEIASVLLGRAYLDRDDAKTALAKYSEAVAKHSGSQALTYGLVKATFLTGDYQAGKKALDKAIKSFGETATSTALGGFHCELVGDYAEAREAYEKALEQDPKHTDALFRLARWHQTWGEEETAVEHYETLREQKPTFAHALMNLGNLYEDFQSWEQAIECYREVLASMPGHPRATIFLQDAKSSKTMYYDEDSERRADRQSAILKIPVTDFELSVRSRNCLNKMNIKTLGDLIQMTEPELLAHKNFGETSLMEVKQMLAQKGLRLGQGKMDGSAFIAPASPVEVSEEILQQHIDGLDLSVRSRKCMERLGITAIGQLIQRTEAELLSAKNFGQTSLNEIKMKLEERGLRLKDAPY
jgi:DNA-directed RNA polymerase subunit alpha